MLVELKTIRSKNDDGKTAQWKSIHAGDGVGWWDVALGVEREQQIVWKDFHSKYIGEGSENREASEWE